MFARNIFWWGCSLLGGFSTLFCCLLYFYCAGGASLPTAVSMVFRALSPFCIHPQTTLPKLCWICLPKHVQNLASLPVSAVIVVVRMFMLPSSWTSCMAGTGASVIAGKSVHNQRIERLWRDVSANVTSELYATFYRFEDDNILNVRNDLHVQALQFVFLPEVNRRMDEFRHAWNSHFIPGRPWIQGMRTAVPRFVGMKKHVRESKL